MLFFKSLTIFSCFLSFSAKMLSITEISVEVVFIPQNAAQSLTTRPPLITGLPLLTVPATSGTCKSELSFSCSFAGVFG